MTGKLKKLKILTLVFIVTIIIAAIAYVSRINIIAPLSIKIYFVDTLDKSKTQVTGVGPVGREFTIQPAKDKTTWKTDGYFFYKLNLKIPGSFFQEEKNYLKINQYTFKVKSFEENTVVKNWDSAKDIVINLQSIEDLTIFNKFNFFIKKLPEMLFGGAFYFTPVIYLFLILMFLYDYKTNKNNKIIN